MEVKNYFPERIWKRILESKEAEQAEAAEELYRWLIEAGYLKGGEHV